jgi:hypothetical protein
MANGMVKRVHVPLVDAELGKKTVSDAADAKSAGGIVLYAAFVRRPVLRFC